VRVRLACAFNRVGEREELCSSPCRVHNRWCAMHSAAVGSKSRKGAMRLCGSGGRTGCEQPYIVSCGIVVRQWCVCRTPITASVR
jgi:hypothetical protein